MNKALLCPALMLVGCATVPAESAGQCDVAKVRVFVGALGTADLGRAALHRSGARTIRWITPGTAVTMDYRRDRLNIRLDLRNFVTGIDCG